MAKNPKPVKVQRMQIAFLVLWFCISFFASKSFGVISPVTVNTLADLKALQPGQYQAVLVLGYALPGDGAQRMVHWNSQSAATDNGCTVTQPTSMPSKGRWITDYSGPLNPKWCGEKSDGVTNDAAAWGLAFAVVAQNGGGEVTIPVGVSIISTPLGIPSGTFLQGLGLASIIKSSANTAWNDSGMIQIRMGIYNVTLKDFVIDGNAIGNATQTAPTSYTRGRSYGIKIFGGRNTSISGVVIKGQQAYVNGGAVNGGDGIYIAATQDANIDSIPRDIEMKGVICDSNYRNAMTVNAVKNLNVVNCIFKRTTGNNPGSGIDFEPDTSRHPVIGAHFSNCAFNENQWGVSLYDARGSLFKDISFIGCRFSKNRDHGIVFEATSPGGVTFDGVMSDSNGNSGIKFGGGANDVKISNSTIASNTNYGIDIQTGSRNIKVQACQIVLNGKSGIQVDYASGGRLYHDFSHNGIWNNGQSATNTYDGVSFLGNVSNDDFTSNVEDNFIGNATQVGASTQRDGVRIAVNATKVHVWHNRFFSLAGIAVNNASGDALIELNYNNNVPYISASGATSINFTARPAYRGDSLLSTGGFNARTLPVSGTSAGQAGLTNSLITQPNDSQVATSAQQLELIVSNPGALNSINARNTSNTANSAARMFMGVAGSSAFGAYNLWGAGTSFWYGGIVPSTGDLAFGPFSVFDSLPVLRLDNNRNVYVRGQLNGDSAIFGGNFAINGSGVLNIANNPIFPWIGITKIPFQNATSTANGMTSSSNLTYNSTTSTFSTANGAFTSTTDATDASTASVTTLGGLGIAKRAIIGRAVTLASTIATTAGGSTTGLSFGSTAPLGIFFGSGAPTITAGKGSLYLRTDGTTVNDRMYVNSSGSTTWTAVTTGL